ncbi:hypothetical protein VII00023_13902 [Vibrio ichthyoenteri ATCC 700023]|uniref:Uncharacterized protein n=1 Tax=Vibrio ichthyoenteri ATCC 700023 TaxID=870968 RepID=F9RWZ4_9VIBR|nr:hypothetical protein VII00023_13902 [Vibrio ichthyoenteri ATCC 700023]
MSAYPINQDCRYFKKNAMMIQINSFNFIYE